MSDIVVVPSSSSRENNALVLEVAVVPNGHETRSVRLAVRAELITEGASPEHVSVCEMTASELVGAALESGARAPLVVIVERFRLLTSIRVRCAGDAHLGDEPFGVRERVLAGLTLAYGRREHADGSVDLWAEVVRAPGAWSSGNPTPRR